MKNITLTLTEEQYNTIFKALIVGVCATDSLKSNADTTGMTACSELYAEWQKQAKTGSELLSDLAFQARITARLASLT